MQEIEKKIRNKEYRSALSQIARILRSEKKTDFAHAYFLAACIRIEQKQLLKARNYLIKSENYGKRTEGTLRNLIIVERQLGNWTASESLLESYNKKFQDSYFYFFQLANLQRDAGEKEKAEELYEKAISTKKAPIEALLNLSALTKRTNPQRAIDCLQQVLKHDPNNTLALTNLALILSDLGLTDKSTDILRTLNKGEAPVSIKNFLAKNLRMEGSISEARQLLNEVLEIDPLNIFALNSLGNLEKDEGNIETAFSLYEKAYSIGLQQKKFEIAPLLNLSSMASRTQVPQVLQLAKKLNPKELTENIEEYYFTLFNLYDRIGEYSKAYINLRIANEIASEKNQEEYFRNRKLFRQAIEYYRPVKPIESVEFKPVLIVGMPRSGTTLLEQLLGNHPEISALGELDALSIAMNNNYCFLRTFTAEMARNISEEYFSYVRRKTKKMISLDKMPLNFRFVGYFLTAFSSGKVIHITKESRSVAWSIHSKKFAGSANSFSHSINWILDMMTIQEKVMRFWFKEFPSRILMVSYEDLIKRREKTIEKILDFIELPYNADCTELKSSNNSIRTASNLQLRSTEIKSNENWRNYQNFLINDFGDFFKD